MAGGGFRAVGDAQAFASLIGLAGRFQVGLADAAEMAGQMLVRTTQDGMDNGPQSGRFHSGMKRQSSAPGEYPAIQSSQLFGSLGYEVERSALRFGSRGAFNRGYDYAIGQHEGNSRIAPRPYLHLTVQKRQAEITAILGETVWQKIIGG